MNVNAILNQQTNYPVRNSQRKQAAFGTLIEIDSKLIVDAKPEIIEELGKTCKTALNDEFKRNHWIRFVKDPNYEGQGICIQRKFLSESNLSFIPTNPHENMKQFLEGRVAFVTNKVKELLPQKTPSILNEEQKEAARKYPEHFIDL